MVVASFELRPHTPRYAGLRMTADEYLELEDDGFRYELIDGVVVMTPSPDMDHQDGRGEIERQVRNFLIAHPVGWVASEIDVRLGDRLVYRPDMIFVSSIKAPRRPRRITMTPDLVVEVLSPSTAAFDQRTKLQDYQKSGVTEYWLVDPGTPAIRFLRLGRMGYAEVEPIGGRFESEAIPGFSLDVAAVLRVCSSPQQD